LLSCRDTVAFIAKMTFPCLCTANCSVLFPLSLAQNKIENSSSLHVKRLMQLSQIAADASK
jgi:hypothetical protein